MQKVLDGECVTSRQSFQIALELRPLSGKRTFSFYGQIPTSTSTHIQRISNRHITTPESISKTRWSQALPCLISEFKAKLLEVEGVKQTWQFCIHFWIEKGGRGQFVLWRLKNMSLADWLRLWGGPLVAKGLESCWDSLHMSCVWKQGILGWG